MKIKRYILFLGIFLTGLYFLIDSFINDSPINYYLLTFLVYVQIVFNQLVLHRIFSHRTFKISWYLRDIFCCFTLLSMFSSSRTYIAMHRLHHRYTDTELDLHGPHQGFFTLIDMHIVDSKLIGKIDKNESRIETFINTYYYELTYGTIFLSLLINTVFFKYLILSVMFNYICIDVFNYFSHKKTPFNYRNYDTLNNSHNNLFLGIFGGDWHNNHHAFPNEPNQRKRWWEFDPIFYFGKVLEKI